MQFELVRPNLLLIGTRFSEYDWVQHATEAIAEYRLTVQDLTRNSSALLPLKDYDFSELVILCAISGTERGLIPLQQATALVAANRTVHIYVEDIPFGGKVGGKKLTRHEVQELNALRDGLRNTARTNGYLLYDDLKLAVASAVTVATILAGV